MAAGVRVQLNHAGMRQLLTSPGVESDLMARAERVLSTARQNAPTESGDYRDSLEAFTESHGERVVAHVGSDVPYAMRIEATTGNLGRALDAARG